MREEVSAQFVQINDALRELFGEIQDSIRCAMQAIAGLQKSHIDTQEIAIRLTNAVKTLSQENVRQQKQIDDLEARLVALMEERFN